MPQVKPLTYYVDTPSVHNFLEVAGENLENLDKYDAWDIVTILCQATSLGDLDDEPVIDINYTLLYLDLEMSEHCLDCLKTLDCFPIHLISSLTVGILSVAFEI